MALVLLLVVQQGCSVCPVPGRAHITLMPSSCDACWGPCAQELMRQASWNLCPQHIQYSSGCYADRDATFGSIAGSSSTHMPDLPDGDWALVLKKDIFQKVCRHV